ncbi:Abhydrolase family protein [Botrimarina mediterranea]|uniref:Abhydrolase family protein n=2 Tax=Botrimarina mediterranea TaxID=2528022 RepID=A0A518K9H9_9BACT|nr:Abhydrolase family protein [Botrimarina mediterranea]
MSKLIANGSNPAVRVPKVEMPESLGPGPYARYACFLLAVGLAVLGVTVKAADPRLGRLVNLRTDRFPFTPPTSVEEWNQRSAEVRRQVFVAAGLWPMPERPAPKAEVLRKVERDAYTVEAVRLESYPGHYVTGSLYRPADATESRRPAVLCPHGHWPEGRFHAFQDDALIDQIESGAERYEAGGRTPLQARCVTLARMGCVVFLYDMLGYGDSRQLSQQAIHAPSEDSILTADNAWGFYSTQAELRMQNPLGVQTYNSLCVLDWIESLPEVDPKRIGVTGGSSGATQTLMLCAVDDRPAVAFPVVMVSTAMQGGCGCENACCLRLGTSNVEFAALMAPRPLGMASADDWTRNTATDGYPELQELYALLGVPDRVMHASLIQFPHNYNYASRAAMYPWLDRWLGLEAGDLAVETDYVSVTPDEVRSVAPIEDAAIGRGHEVALMKAVEASSADALAKLTPTDADSLNKYKNIIGKALHVLLDGAEKSLRDAQANAIDQQRADGHAVITLLITGAEAGVELPALARLPRNVETIAVVVSDAGKTAIGPVDTLPTALAAALLEQGIGVLGVDLFAQGELAPDDGPLTEMPVVANQRPVASLTFGYNRTAVAHRASDLLATIAAAKDMQPSIKKVVVIVEPEAASYGAAALAVAGDAVDAAVIDTGGFRFDEVRSWRDPDFLPGAVKYGDVPGLLAQGAPRPTIVLSEPADDTPSIATQAYAAAGAAERLIRLRPGATLESAVEKLADTLAP